MLPHLQDKPLPIQAYEMFKAGFKKKEIAAFFHWPMQKTHTMVTRGKNYDKYSDANRLYRSRTYIRSERQSLWKEKLVDKLIVFWMRGYSASLISEQKPFQGKFTRNAIIGKIHRLRDAGILKDEDRAEQKRKRWKYSEEALASRREVWTKQKEARWARIKEAWGE